MKIRDITEDIVNEISTDTLSRYKKAAGKSAREADKAGNYQLGNKRFSGIIKATKKQFDNDAKKTTKEGVMDGEEDFANALYNAFEEQYPNLCRRAGSHAVGNAIMDFMQYDGQIDPENLVQDLARTVKSSLTSVEF